MSSFGSVGTRELFSFAILNCQVFRNREQQHKGGHVFSWVNGNFFPLGVETHNCMQKMNLTVIPILTFSNQLRESMILVMTSRDSSRFRSMSPVTIDRCLCDHVKKSHTEKEIKVGLKLHWLSGYLMDLDDILEDSSAKGPLWNDNFEQRFQLSNSILQTRQSVVQIKTAEASTELAKGDKKSILVSF